MVVWLYGAAAHCPLEPPLPLPPPPPPPPLTPFQNFWIKSVSGYCKLYLTTSLAALNTIVVYSWTITIEQSDRLVVQVCTSELKLHQYEDTEDFT